MAGRASLQEFYIEVAVHSTNSNITYVGKAALSSGGRKDRDIWQISRIVEDGDNCSIRYADGDPDFNNVWDNREVLGY